MLSYWSKVSLAGCILHLADKRRGLINPQMRLPANRIVNPARVISNYKLDLGKVFETPPGQEITRLLRLINHRYDLCYIRNLGLVRIPSVNLS